ncbi:MAG TPA: hypothetical protein VK430_04415 [Xanthobacteraceae bacterium]|nr:hypothetical protein [Xanthobacteraceae bacterium]
MKADLEDALVPVKWAEAQIPVLQERLLAWQRSRPYEIVTENDPQRSDMELLVAYRKKPLDPLIVGDVGAIINSVRTALDLTIAAVVARHGIVPDRAPNFPNAKTSNDFSTAVKKLETEYGCSPTEVAYIERAKAYDGGDAVLWHICKLDNLRKHQRLLTVEPIPSTVNISWIYYAERIMEHSHAQNKTKLYRIPRGVFRPTDGNTNLTPDIFLNEAPSGVGIHPAIVALRVYSERVYWLISEFP